MNTPYVPVGKDKSDINYKYPVIVSASRSTDIPAFYADWFFERLKLGYSVWVNPFNNVRHYISYRDTRLIVFWSKNPHPLLSHLDSLKTAGIHTYIQFTLNDYEKEGLEKGVPPLQERIDTFRLLVDKLDADRVIWRFDPLILTDKISCDDLLEKMNRIGNQLNGYTHKLVFSFADIGEYRKVKSNLEKSGVRYRNFEKEDMVYIAKGLAELNTKWKYSLATCGERANLDKFGIRHNKCIDDDLIVRCFPGDRVLMNYLGVEFDLFAPDHYRILKKNKDTGQRSVCGCIASKDIGMYNTCLHQCEYCYANTSKEIAAANYKRHLSNPHSETITGIWE